MCTIHTYTRHRKIENISPKWACIEHKGRGLRDPSTLSGGQDIDRRSMGPWALSQHLFPYPLCQ